MPYLNIFCVCIETVSHSNQAFPFPLPVNACSRNQKRLIGVFEVEATDRTNQNKYWEEFSLLLFQTVSSRPLEPVHATELTDFQMEMELTVPSPSAL